MGSIAVSLPIEDCNGRKHSNRTLAIVKLFLRFAGQDKNAPWAMGTGWLISNETIVTAGHCAYDWSHNLGRLTHVKAYVGYYGKESIKDSRAVQLRFGKRVAVPQGWLASRNNEARDVAFIQVDRPYTGIKPIKYQQTPLTGAKVALGVIGYPGDLMNAKSKEKGAVSLPSGYYDKLRLTSESLCMKCTMVRRMISPRQGTRCSSIRSTLMEVRDICHGDASSC